VRILLGGFAAIVLFVGAGLRWIFFYSGELPQAILLRQSS
jgi:hypothetical protein